MVTTGLKKEKSPQNNVLNCRASNKTGLCPQLWSRERFEKRLF